MKASDIAVEVVALKFKDSKFRSGDRLWDAATLVEAAKDCPVFELPLIAIDIGVNPWDCTNIRGYAQHMKRVKMSDLKYPVIMDDYGYICDGWHRVVKALLLGHKTIKAQRLIEMPEADENVSA